MIGTRNDQTTLGDVAGYIADATDHRLAVVDPEAGVLQGHSGKFDVDRTVDGFELVDFAFGRRIALFFGAFGRLKNVRAVLAFIQTA